MKKKVISILLAMCFIMLTPVFATEVSAIPSEEAFASTIQNLQNTYQHGKYWNKASSSDYSRTGNIACNGVSYSSAHSGMSCSAVGYCDNCSCECGYFNGAWQCMGFANKMA